MRYSRLVIGFCISIALLTACGGKSSNGSASKLVPIQPPVMLRASLPELPPDRVDVQVSVLVDEYGVADMKTIKISGVASGRARQAIRSWFAEARFSPARRNGNPVAAVYNTGIKTRVAPGH